MPRALYRCFAPALALLAILAAGACTVPLAPGFHIDREQAQAEFISGSAPHLHIHITNHLTNTGNAPLSVLNANLPNPTAVARENLRITIDGADASVEPLSSEAAPSRSSAPFEIRLPKPWTEKQRITLEIDFDIAAANNRSVLLAANAFAVDSHAWFPRFEAPKHFFAKGEERAEPTEIVVVVPHDFAALSSGQATGRKARANEIEYRFRVRRYDSEPFLVGGRYNRQAAKASDSTIYFWTFAGLPADAVQRAGDQMGAAAAFFDSTFGLRSQKGKPPIWIIESPASGASQPSDAERQPRLSQSLPNVVLLAPDVIAERIAHGQITDAELTLLAETWTRWVAFPRSDERFLGPSLATYAVEAWHESREGESQRRARIADLLRAYDASETGKSARRAASASASGQKAPPPEAMSREKASLFLVALDDQCTPTRVHQGLAYSLTSLRGREYGYDDLRAGLHSQGCTELGPTFREWLNHPGIPEDFRNRYGAGAPATSSAPGNAAPSGAAAKVAR
jgi:broad specificity polyphosphatase/5'/3'-nucleotidase SurE